MQSPPPTSPPFIGIKRPYFRLNLWHISFLKEPYFVCGNTVVFHQLAFYLAVRVPYLLEVKYVKESDSKDKEQALLTDACTQLLQYVTDPIVTQTIGSATLRLITVVFRT